MKKIPIVMLLCILLTQAAFSDNNQVLKKSWAHYIKQKVAINGRPLADKDQADLSKGSYGKELTFSETVSYVLFRAVLIDDQKTFDEVWEWSVNNLMRKNIPRVFNWASSRWQTMPEEKKDYLFAWRYTPNIKRTNIGGIVYVPSREMPSQGWRNGIDAAPDGDQLIAGALIMAHNKWGSRDGEFNYQHYAKNIISDVWEKCVTYKELGVLDDFENDASIGNWFTYADSSGRIMKSLEEQGTNQYYSLESFGAKWYGVGKYIGGMDISNYEGIKFSSRENNGVKIILEDTAGNKVSYTKRYGYSDVLETHQVHFSSFSREDFDWASINNILFQPVGDCFALDNVAFLIPGQDASNSAYHLLSNDRGDPWINISYYMPFLYESFAQYDPGHPWEELLEDALVQIKKSKSITLYNEAGQKFKGNGALVPDWCMLSNDNQFTDLPWAQDGKIDDYLHSWDAFRTWYFLGLTNKVSPERGVEKLLRDGTFQFFTEKLRKENKLLGGYAINGKTLDVRGIQYEYPSSYGVYLAYFTALGEDYYTEKILRKLRGFYRRAGYWGDNPNDYYKQNWAWMGLYFYENKGENVKQLLKYTEQVALKYTD